MKYNINEYSLDSYDAIKDLYLTASNISCCPDPNKFPRYRDNNAVIDEDKSVKWNREEVERRNKAYNDEVARLNRIRNAEVKKVADLIIVLIAEDVKFSIKNKTEAWYEHAAKIVYREAYEAAHSYGMRDVLDKINVYCTIISEVINFE